MILNNPFEFPARTHKFNRVFELILKNFKEFCYTNVNHDHIEITKLSLK